MAGATPIEYNLPMIEGWGIYDATTIDILKPFFNQKIKAVIVTSPSYEGVVSDIQELKEFCHKQGAYLIIDEAHGALYPFNEKLPQSAVNIADFTVQSLHKTAGGLNPTALLHTMTDLDINSALSKINTTSPSYPLLATIENNIHFLNSEKGRKKIDNLIEQIKKYRLNCTNVEFYDGDITKILIKKEGVSGFELSEKLYACHIEDERANGSSVLLLTGVGTSEKKLDYLFKKLDRI